MPAACHDENCPRNNGSGFLIDDEDSIRDSIHDDARPR